MVKILLETSMFVAGFIGFVLDNTIPGEVRNFLEKDEMKSATLAKIPLIYLGKKCTGTREERGLVAWEAQFAKDSDCSDESCYDIPFVMGLIRK